MFLVKSRYVHGCIFIKYLGMSGRKKYYLLWFPAIVLLGPHIDRPFYFPAYELSLWSRWVSRTTHENRNIEVFPFLVVVNVLFLESRYYSKINSISMRSSVASIAVVSSVVGTYPLQEGCGSLREAASPQSPAGRASRSSNQGAVRCAFPGRKPVLLQ